MADNKYKCCQCGERQPLTNFFKSYSTFYANGRLPICKECFIRDVKLYSVSNGYKSTKKAMRRMCMAFDIYFDDGLYAICDTNEPEVKTLVGNYLKRLNMAQYRGKTFEDSIAHGGLLTEDENASKTIEAIQPKDEPGEETISPEDIQKWGVGLTPTDYENLNTHYKYLTSANPHCDSNQEIFIIDLCYTKMQQLRCIRDGDMDNFKKMGEYYNATFSKSGLKVTNESDNGSDDLIGVWAARIAQYTPEEYYKNKKLYKDSDNLGEYIERFLLRPQRNLQTGSSDRDFEYYVKDVGDEDEFIDADTENV